MYQHHDMLWSTLSLGAALAGPWLFYTGFKAWSVRRLIEATPASRIRSMAMGLVELNGSVTERSRVSAPFSGRPCAYWEVEIATRSSSRNDGRSSWTTVHRNRSGHPFYLRDETGTALVYPQGAECHMPFGVEEQTHGLGVPECYSEYMQAQGLGMRGVWALGPMRFRERMLEDDARVFVLGRAFPRAQSSAVSWDEEPAKATGTDGMADARLRALDAEVRGVVRRGTQDPVFVISQSSEKTMAFEYGLKAFGGLAGGPLLTLFGVWCLIELARSGQLFH